MRSELRSGLEIAALVGFAVVQPVLGPFGESPETFTAAGAGPGQIVLFAVAVAVVPLLTVWALAAVSRVFGAQVRSVVQTVVVAGLAALAAVGVARHVGSGAVVRAGAALVVGGLVVVVHRRWAPLSMFLRYASPVPVLLLLVFLLASPVAPLVRPPAVEVDQTAAGDHPPVVFIVLDELPTLSLVDGAGGIDETLVPNLARVADTSTWYRNHTAVAPYTAQSLPAMLTGRQAIRATAAQPATYDNYPDNLITLLARTHEVHGREWATQMCPPSLCPEDAAELDEEATALLANPLSERVDPLDTLVGEARTLWWSQVWPTEPDYTAGYALAGMTDADDITRPMVEFLSGIDEQTGDRPVFDYLHSPLPHIPWVLLPSGETYDGPDPPFGAEILLYWPEGETGEQLAAAGQARHLLQLQWTDRLLGAIIDRLEALDRWDDAVVVVTADHGVAFQSGHHMRLIDPATQVATGWTPLFIKEPGQREASVVDDNVNALDVLPTLADLAGVEVDWEVEGRSLADGDPPADRAKPMIVREPEDFATVLEGDVVALDADGLGAIESAPATGPPSDELRVWRHGRHGDLLGRRISDVGVCEETGPVGTFALSELWDEYVAGTLEPSESLPLWLEGTLDAPDARDIAASVDGTVAAWGTSHFPAADSDAGSSESNVFGLLLSEPVIRDAVGSPVLYEIVDEPGCGLRRLAR
ncbi:hypothetical protein BH23ACT2_BH23ACT2_29020 [soil metagenome]